MKQNIIDNNFIYIPNFISKERATELADRFTKFCKTKQASGDTQAHNSHSVYNYVDFLELLCEKTPEVTKFLGETVLPTYTYARVYKENSVLERHRDREACEISLTLHLGGDTEWPIYIQKPNGEEVRLNLNKGDAMLYLGDIADHWREEYEGKEYVQIFMHYVRSRGENSWAVFDKERRKPRGTVETITIDDVNDSPSKLTNKSVLTQIVTKPEMADIPSMGDYIKVFDNVLSDKICDIILHEYKNCSDWVPAGIGSGNTGVVNREIRNVDTIGMSFEQVIARNPELRKFIDNEIFKGANSAIRQYNECFPEAMIEEDSGYELLRYHKGQFYKKHTDSFKLRPRAVSCSFSLNDDYDGGEWSFWGGQKILRAKKGSVIMFPSNFMYPHEILPVTDGTRYSIITWFV